MKDADSTMPRLSFSLLTVLEGGEVPAGAADGRSRDVWKQRQKKPCLASEGKGLNLGRHAVSQGKGKYSCVCGHAPGCLSAEEAEAGIAVRVHSQVRENWKWWHGMGHMGLTASLKYLHLS